MLLSGSCTVLASLDIRARQDAGTVGLKIIIVIIVTITITITTTTIITTIIITTIIIVIIYSICKVGYKPNRDG